MTVIARDHVASDQLVYAWPFPLGPDELEVSCGPDELVVMCPAWQVGDRLGPGRHRWRTPDPSRPSAAYFVRTAPVEASFDLLTQFIIPATGQPVRLRANGTLQLCCVDPLLLIAQFVGLPFQQVNDGILRSASRSIERMLARLLVRRVVMAGTPHVATDPATLPGIVEELVAYNPTAGAVFGVELVRFAHVTVLADDGRQSWHQLELARVSTGPAAYDVSERVRAATQPTQPPPLRARTPSPAPAMARASEPGVTEGAAVSTAPRGRGAAITPDSGATVSGELGRGAGVGDARAGVASGEVGAVAASVDGPRGEVIAPRPTPIEVASAEESTQPGVSTPRPESIPPVPPAGPGASIGAEGGTPIAAASGEPAGSGADADDAPVSASASAGARPDEARGSILGIGVSHIGSSEVASGEIVRKVAPGGRVLVPGPNGLMQSATVRQLLQGYYELEVGGSGERIWVPVAGVVPE